MITTDWLSISIAVGNCSVFFGRSNCLIPWLVDSLVEGRIVLGRVGLGGDTEWIMKYIAPGAAAGLFHVILGLAMVLFFR